MDSSFSDSDDDSNFEYCTKGGCCLAYEASSLENIILMITDNFNFRVLLESDRARGALLLTSGLAIAGGVIGSRYGGKLGAAVGGAFGGACGLGIVAVSMREIWDDVKSKLPDLFDLVYDYLANLGIEDYKKAAMFLAGNSSCSSQLAMIILQVASDGLGKKIVSSLTPA